MATNMNAQEYFANRLNDMALAEQEDPIGDRFNRMVEASNRRTAELAEAGARRRVRLEQNSGAIANRLGLDPDGLAAQATNLGASAVTGVGRLAGHILSAPASLAAAAETAGLTNADWDAYNAMQRGEATPEQMNQLNREGGSEFTLGNISRALEGNFNNATPLQRIQAANAMRQGARSINDMADWGSLVDQTRRTDFSEDLGSNFQANWDKTTDGTVSGAASGIAGLLSEAGRAAVNNPGAIAEYVAENIPQLALGAFGAAGRAGMGASNVGYAADNFQKGIEKYQKENNGAYPPAEVREEMALWAASTALAEQVGDMSLLRGITGAAGNAADAGRRSLLSVLREGAKGVATEAATEGFQTYAEGQAGLDPASPQDIYEGAVIGGLVGGAMQGGGAGIVATAQRASEALNRADTSIAEKNANTAAFDEAVAKNDPSFFTKPGANYAPADAVRVLVKAANEENQEANVTAANEVVATAQARLEDLNQRVERASNPEESKAAIEAQIAAIDAADTTAPNYDAEIAQLQKEDLQEDLALVDADVQNLTRLKTEQSKLTRQVTSAARLLDQFNDRSNAQEVAEATTEEAAAKTINLAMTAPSKVDSATVKTLVEDTTNALTPAQRTYLRAMDEARVAENAAKDINKVNTEVLYGSNKNVGIKQYRERVSRALVGGNVAAAKAVVASLAKFTQGYQSKAAAVNEAFQKANETGETYSVVPNRSGQWSVSPELLSDAQRRKVGGLNIHARSNASGLVDAANYEAQATRTALAELQAAIAATPTAPVAVQSQAPASSGATAQAAPSTDAIKEKMAKGMDYLSNPPADFNVREARKIGTWAKAQVARINAAQKDVAADDFDRMDELSDLKSEMKILANKSDELVKSEAERIEYEEANVAPEAREPVVESEPDVMMVQNVDTAQAQGVSTSSVTEAPKKLSKEEAKKVGYKKLNLVDQYISTQEARDTDTTEKALVSTPDLLTKLRAEEINPADFVEGNELTEKQSTAIYDFTSKAGSWLNKIQANFFLGNPDYRFTDPIQFMLTRDADGNIVAPENLKTAIAYAAYAWVNENSSMPRFNTKDGVKKMFGLSEYSKISDDLYSAVRGAGEMEKRVINAMGQKAIAALGLKADEGAPSELMATLAASIGAQSLKLLEDEGIVVRKVVDGNTISKGLPKQLDAGEEGLDVSTNNYADFGFISLARNAAGDLNQVAEEITKAQRGSQSVLNKMFDAEAAYIEPSLTPIKRVQQTTKNTDQPVPSNLQEIMRYENSVPNYLRPDTWFLVSQLDDESMLQIAGFDNSERQFLHKVNRDSVEAKNNGLQRELANAREYFSQLGEDAAMYFEHSVWKQQRVGIATNLINPQTSKIHRFMIYRPEWETEVSLMDSEMMDNFRLRVAEGLGVKTDKQGNEKSLADYEKKVNDPIIQNGVRAIYATSFAGADMTPEFQDAIVQAVKAGGEDMHSLDALIALAHEFDALANNKDSFTTRMMGEVDGVTNGPMLSHLMMGAGVTVDSLYEMLNRGGFYKQGQDFVNYNVWRAAEGNQDLYETTIGNVMKRVQGLTTIPEMKNALTSLYAITGDLVDANEKVVKAGRNIIKTPLTAMVFGSSVDGAIDSMFEKFIETAYERIEKTKSPAETLKLVRDINNLITFGGGTETINESITQAEWLEKSFTKGQEDALQRAFNLTLGDSVKETMAVDFAVFMEGRKVYNTAAQAAFQLYDAAVKGLTDSYMNELMDSGELAFTTIKGVRTPLHDLNNEQQAELRTRLAPVTPILQTLNSLTSEEPNAGLTISKASRKLSTKKAYEVEAHFGTPTTTGSKTRKAAAIERSLTAPGVAMLPMAAHSTDSAISHNAVMGNGGTATQVLNVHDAHGTGLKYFQRTAQNLNKATFDAMLNYSPATQMTESLISVVQGMNTLLQDADTARLLAPYIKANLATLAKSMPKALRDDPLGNAMQDIAAMARTADRIKFDTLASMAAVDQYALEGGQYTVTDEDRAAAREKGLQIRNDIGAENLAAAAAIVEASKTGKAVPASVDEEYDAESYTDPATALAKTVSPVVTSTVGSLVQEGNALASGKPVEAALAGQTQADKAKVVQAVGDAAKAVKSLFSPWGEIGESTVNHDEDLVAAFEATPTMNKAQVLNALRVSMVAQQAPKNIKEFNAKLFTVLAKLVPANISVKYVTPDTDASEIMEKGTTNARGWYVAQNERAEIYILSKEHKNAAITPEVLLHELTHSVLAGIVENIATQPAEVQELVAELDVLRNKAKEVVETNNLTQFAPAVENIHEYIAYGMTNLDFQKQVISKTSIESKTRKNTLVQGMKAFIDNVVGILFRGSERSRQAIAVNGMTALISNVSGLFNAVSKVPSKANVILNAQSLDPLDVAMNLTTVELFNAIQDSNPDNQNGAAFTSHMSDLLTGIVSKLHGPFGSIKAMVMANQAMTPVDIYSKAINTGSLPFASRAIVGGFKVSNQEAFVMDQVQATVQATLDRNETQVAIAHKELRKVFLEARQKIKPMDLLPNGVTVATASQDDKDAANALWNFAFKAQTNADGTSDYISGFAALALGHEFFASKLGFATDSLDNSDTSLWGRAVAAFNQVMDWVAGILTGTRAGDPALERVTQLVDKLVDIEAKRRLQVPDKDSAVAKFEEITRNLSDQAKLAISKFGDSKFFKNSQNGYIRLSGTAMNMVAAPERVEALLEKIQEMRDKSFKDKQGILSSLVSEMQGITDDKAVIGKLLLATKNIERARKEAISNTASFVKKSFGKREFTAQEHKDVTNVFLRTDLSALVDDYSMADLDKLLTSQKYRRDQIDQLSNQLNKDPNVVFYANGIKGLAYYMATGKVRIPHLLMNAHNIARLGGYNTSAVTEEHALSVEPIIDKLISLHALDYLSQAERNTASNVLREQNNRTDGGNGVEMILKLHKQLQADSKKHLFEGNDALFMKGYTTEIYNPYVDIKVADDVEGRELMLAGYSRGEPLSMDNLDNTAQKSIYIVHDGGLAAHVTGTLSLTDMKSRGTVLRNDTYAETQRLISAKNVEMAQMNRNFIEPDKVSQNYMAPVLNNAGDVAEYRYLMSKNTKDTALMRDNRFDKILGAYSGSVLDKQVSPVQNKAVVQALFDQFDGEDVSQKDRYLEISPTSADPELREHWNLLPAATKEAVREIWGSEKMYVRPDMMDINFGYRKYTLANTFKKDASERAAMEKLFVFAVESIVRGVGASKGLRGNDLDAFVQRSGLYTRRAEDMWQEIVREAKDIIVVRTGVVLLGNISSNLTELAWMGVPMKDIVRHHQVALRAASDYQRDSARLAQIETMLNSGYIEGTVGELEQEAVLLRDAINRSPVKELIDAGLMPTIVEDLDNSDDIYSYKSRFARNTEFITNKLNDKVKTAAKYAYISQDTALYKSLNRATQLSDFVARYTLYHHVTSRAVNPMSKDEAVRYASDAFVNYDIPSHRSVQYMNDMGIVMFTKYYIRIQKVLMRMFRENPARAMMMMAFSHFFSNVPTVLDGSLLNKLSYNPLSAGAFKYPTVLDDLATVKLGMSPFN